MKKRIAIMVTLAIGVLLFSITSGFIDNVGASHEGKWTVSSGPGWWNGSSNHIVDIRTTISDGELQLLGPDTVGWWSLDDDSDTSTATDLTSLYNDGTIKDPTYVSGKFDKALDFDGNDWVEVSDDPSLDIANEITLMAWIKWDGTDTGARQKVVSKKNNYYLEMGTNYLGTRGEPRGSVRVNGYNYDIESGIYVGNDWAHVTLVYDGSEERIYVNGTLGNSRPVSGSIETDTNVFSIGSHGLKRYFDGKIDSVMVFDRALTEDKIQRIYNRTEPSSMMSSDLQTGTWTSKVWGTETPEKRKVDNLIFSSTVGSNEDIFGKIGSDTDDDGKIDSSTGWVELSGESWDSPNVDSGYAFQVEYKLKTDNTSHSPSVSSFSLSISPEGGGLDIPWTLIVWGSIVVAVLGLGIGIFKKFSSGKGRPQEKPSKHPLEVLKLRLAKGEITEEEYERIKDKIVTESSREKPD